MTDANGDGRHVPERPPRPARPLPFVLSSALGVVGLVLLVPGLAFGSTVLALTGFAAGALSLGAALYWRSQLISAWAQQKRGRPHP